MITIQRSKGGDISDFCPKKDLVFYFTSSKYSSTFLSTVEFSFYRTAQNRDFWLYRVVYVRIYMYKCVSKLCTVLCATLISFHDQSKLVFVLDLLPSPYLSHSKQKWYHIFQQICSFSSDDHNPWKRFALFNRCLDTTMLIVSCGAADCSGSVAQLWCRCWKDDLRKKNDRRTILWQTIAYNRTLTSAELLNWNLWELSITSNMSPTTFR